MGGDGTVPRVSATPIEMSATRREIYAAEMHGSLQNADGPLANVKGALTRSRLDLDRFRAPAPTGATLTLDLDDVILPGEPLVVRARASSGERQIDVQLTHIADGKALSGRLAAVAGSPWQLASFDRLAAGAWRVRVSAPAASSVTDLAVVAEKA
jgi:hypothetical protein